jgi:hypothetical protein
MNVCVFCSSSSRLAPQYVEAAERLGRWIGRNQHTLVWGGCNVGLMDVVGHAVRGAGGRTHAVIPHFLVERGLAFNDADERDITVDMQERKARFRSLADAFVALPGGVGTWEELFEVLALKKLEQLDAPIVIADIGGYYEPLLEQLRRSYNERFTSPDVERLYDVARDADSVIACLERAPGARGLA